MMPLRMARIGETNCIRKITGKDDVKQRLAELGLVVGGEVTLVSEIFGNIIVSVKGSRIALDNSMADRILV
ncbi:MAG TPA: ferrous iron transport protein A [Clostridiales bacterium]|jgi:ferrous iron transport protein A|nr:ferrous iron transport protein A [Clostridiales bacterium]